MNVSTRFPATLVRLLMPWVLALAVADAAAQATASPEARLKALGIELPPPPKDRWTRSVPCRPSLRDAP